MRWYFGGVVFALVTLCFGVGFFGYTTAYSLDEIMGNIDPRHNPNFHPVTKQIYLRTEAYNAFTKMATAAAQDKVKLRIRSGFRNFREQVGLFRNLSYEKAMPPGTSSHNFGTAVDISEVYSGSVAYKRLQKNAASYGFCQTYDGKSSDQISEPWHREYMPETHRELVSEHINAIYPILVKQQLVPKKMTEIELLDNYIFPISSKCTHMLGYNTSSKTTLLPDMHDYYENLRKLLLVSDFLNTSGGIALYDIVSPPTACKTTIPKYLAQTCILRFPNGQTVFAGHGIAYPLEILQQFISLINQNDDALTRSKLRRQIKVYQTDIGG